MVRSKIVEHSCGDGEIYYRAMVKTNAFQIFWRDVAWYDSAGFTLFLFYECSSTHIRSYDTAVRAIDAVRKKYESEKIMHRIVNYNGIDVRPRYSTKENKE